MPIMKGLQKVRAERLTLGVVSAAITAGSLAVSCPVQAPTLRPVHFRRRHHPSEEHPQLLWQQCNQIRHDLPTITKLQRNDFKRSLYVKLNTLRMATTSALVAAAFGVALPTASAAPTSAAPRAEAPVKLNDLTAEPGKTTSFARDAAWTFFKLKGDHHLAANSDGSVYIEDGKGGRLLTMTPKAIHDTAGNLHNVTWTVKGNTLYQHIDTPNATLKGVVTPTAEARGFGDWIKCVGQHSLDSAEVGAIGGCVVGLETGCVAGASVGGFGGSLAGAVQGAQKC
ncbi:MULTISPECIES: hypothetical protein [Streptomyces]|uniref:hypothetical protein n=1 Tax=Streptomyces TaxID=1883 RepID=UPI00345BE47D